MRETPHDPKTAIDFWKRFLAPSHVEDSYAATTIEGEIPREVRGILYRVGPSQNMLPPEGHEALSIFDGDGLLHAFRIEDGCARYTSRFVRNQSFLAEQRAGRCNQNFFSLAVTEPTQEVLMRQQHNTNAVYHHGKLFAMTENAPPFEVDPATLESIGLDSFQGKLLTMSTTAHPKIDGKTGEMVIHGYQFLPPFLALYVRDAGGACTLAEAVDLSEPTVMHDFAITEGHVIFPICPMRFKPPEFGPFGPVGVPRDWIYWDPERTLRFAIRRREAGSKLMWFDAPNPRFLFHPGNAYEKDGKIYMDACSYPDGGAVFRAARMLRSGELPPAGTAAHRFLYTFDLRTGACTETQMDDRYAEFPRIDDRRVGYENRWGYALVDAETTFGPTATKIGKHEHLGGSVAVHDFSPGHFPGEPIFVPRRPSSVGPDDEDDGFILTVVYDAAEDRSYLAILDARDLSARPLAKVHVRSRIPFGFHGNFAQGVV